MKIKNFLLFFSIILSLQAELIEIQTLKLDLNYLNSLEKGLKRDFYINEYLKTNIDKEQAFQTLSLIDNMSNELFFNFADKFKDDETLAVAQCMKMDLKNLVDSYADCIVIGLSLEEASNLSSIDLQLVIQKVSEKYPIFVEKLKIISSSIPFTKLIVQKEEIFYDIYLNVSNTFREKYFNYKLPSRTFKRVFSNSKKFNKFLSVSLKNDKLDKLNKFLLDIDDTTLNANSSFLLALNALRFNDINKAMKYLQSALSKSSHKLFKEKIVFWKYQITKDKTYLEELLFAKDISFYKLYANEVLNAKAINFTTIKRVKNLDNILKEYDNKRVSLLYSISKVLSNFDRNKVSKSFNIGFMQLSPNFINSISSSLNEETTFSKQFEIEQSIKYANIHLDNLEKLYSNAVFTYLAYISDYKTLNKIKELLSFDFFDYKSFLVFEYINKAEKLKEFISYLYLYSNLLENRISLSSIFESLVPLDQKLDEKVLK